MRIENANQPVRARPLPAREPVAPRRGDRSADRPGAADVRRIPQPHLLTGQPSHRLSARLPVPRRRSGPMRFPPASTSCCRCAAAAGSPAFRSESGRRTTACRSPPRLRGDTGIQVHWSNEVAGATGAVTARHAREPAGSRRQRRPPGRGTVHGPAGHRPDPRHIGVARAVRGVTAPQPRRHRRTVTTCTQAAWGADAEYSRGYYLVRFEAIVSRWRLPGLRRAAARSAAPRILTSRSKAATSSCPDCTARRDWII